VGSDRWPGIRPGGRLFLGGRWGGGEKGGGGKFPRGGGGPGGGGGGGENRWVRRRETIGRGNKQ